jgi:hypothetical protein
MSAGAEGCDIHMNKDHDGNYVAKNPSVQESQHGPLEGNTNYYQYTARRYPQSTYVGLDDTIPSQ